MQIHYPGQTGFTMRRPRYSIPREAPRLPPLAQVSSEDALVPPRLSWKLAPGEEYIVMNGAAFSVRLVPGAAREGIFLRMGKHNFFYVYTYRGGQELPAEFLLNQSPPADLLPEHAGNSQLT